MTDPQHNLILVTGGTGKTGRRVIERLAAAGHDARVGSRSGSPAFDWENRSTWDGALDGVSAVYLSYFPDLAVDGAADTVAAFSALAVERGARRLVLLSGRGEPEAQRAERLVQELGTAGGAETTVVRCSWFNQNFDESHFAEPIAGGVLALPAADVKTPFVDADDIADVAVAALTQDGHAGEVYDLSGPRAIGFDEAVAEIAAASGRPAQYVPISIDDFVAGARAEGVPEEAVGLMRYLFTEVMVPSNGYISDGVERALGRPPRDFREFAREAAAAGAWNA
jgi:uncharacterized protein YbjT (DUF2867 family)